MSKKLLLVTYYWPPKGGVGVLRWLKMSKYLPEFGWEVTVLTPTVNKNIHQDISLLAEVNHVKVIQHPIWEPYAAFNVLRGKKSDSKIETINTAEEKPGFISNVGNYVRGNFFIPDARKFWIEPAARRIELLLKHEHFEVIASTGPPHSMHLAVLKGNKNNTPWVADFRDPWTDIDFVDDLYMGVMAKRKNAQLERQVLQKADVVITVSEHWRKLLESKTSGVKVQVIHNGFDKSDFDNLKGTVKNEAFTLAHIGTLNKKRNPTVLWEALSKVKFPIKIQLIGGVDASIFSSLANVGLNNIEHHAQLPYKEALQMGKNADVLFLQLQDFRTKMGRIPAKLFEYLAMRKPIIFIGPPESDAATLIKEVTNLPVFDYGQSNEILSFLKQVQGGTFSLNTNKGALAKYERKHLAMSFVELLNLQA